MTRRFFGTDGVRGRVGVSPMTPEFALKLGWAAGRVLARTPGARVLVGKDTRRSGYMFESALEAGFAAAGVETFLTGPLPTPAVAYLTKALRAQAGIVISASHNPHFDNGVKFFSADGDKLSDEIEIEIENELERELICVPSELLGRARRIDDAQGRYIEFCKGTFGRRSLHGLKIVLDCANGAAYKVGPAVLRELGADLIVIGDAPNGLNINADCGSTHLQMLKDAVLRHQAHAGIALDGDGDRCLMVTEAGRGIDGDEILYVIAAHRLARGGLRGPVVGTVMSNLGLERALQALELRFERTSVGDRHVLSRLKASGGVLGGETSGHTICLDRASTGDGIVTALQVLEAMQAADASLTTLLKDLQKFPQVLINVPVSLPSRLLMEASDVRAALAATERRLHGHGRVLLRASGTEPLIRVMVEAENDLETRQAAEQLASVVREAELGARAA